MSNPKNSITAFLAALVATPDDEDLPTITPKLFGNDSSDCFKNLKKETADLKFWKRFDDFYDELSEKYNAKERNKIIDSDVSDDASDKAAKAEFKNISDSSDEIALPMPDQMLEPLKTIIDSDNPIDTARQAFRTSGRQPLDWAEGLTQWQP